MNAACLDEAFVLGFLDGTLSEQVRSDVEAHVTTCHACAELLTWAAADRANRSRSAGREGRPFIGRLEPGSRVDRYQILSAVGRGGMGEVYAAYHPDLDRRIALKVVSESSGDTAEHRARLLREARAIARLSHPNVVSVYDAGTVGDGVYISMEFVEGETLDEWLRSKPRGWRDVVDVFIDAGRGLRAAHEAGIIHRDFKPQNVMIGRDGSVRVMDFGLARLTEEPEVAAATVESSDERLLPPTVTKTGALVGTLAYMAPEQFRGEKVDARADQFAFCVALHEALYGRRPALAHVTPAPAKDVGEAREAANVPAWLRAVVSSGLAEQREKRFASMDDLLRRLLGGRSRPRRRAVGASAAVAVLLVALGGWRVARGSRISCALPTARLAAVWSGHEDARRQSIHRAFSASGRPAAEASWQRFSEFLDDYVSQWSAMYVNTCEATHVRGEQSGEALDLRMSCLNESLEEVRALASVLSTADATAVSNSVATVHSLTPVQRCADLAVLRSALPLPRDPKTLETVRQLSASVKEAAAMRDLAEFPGALSRAKTLRPHVEALGYRPLIAEVLELIGGLSAARGDLAQTETLLKQAVFTAIAAHDDATAAKAATDLIYFFGVRRHRPEDAETWFHITEAILDRLGPGAERTRAWAIHDFGVVVALRGQTERAEHLLREAIALKERALGKQHPDVAISLGFLGQILNQKGHSSDALAVTNRALDILANYGDPDSNGQAEDLYTKGSALVGLGRGAEAEACFLISLRVALQDLGPSDPTTALRLAGLGEARVVQGAYDRAIPILENALRIQETRERLRFNVAETRFWLARALWESGKDRRRALMLGAEAKKEVSTGAAPALERDVIDWLARHKPHKS